MTRPPFSPGQFVWCRFPYFESPLTPGDKERIVYVADIRQRSARRLLTVMSLYTTTRDWDPASPLPPGVIAVSKAMAAKMNQKPFVIDARRIAFIPVTDAYFPRLASGDAIVHEATTGFRHRIEAVLLQLVNRPDLIAILGPDAPHRR